VNGEDSNRNRSRFTSLVLLLAGGGLLVLAYFMGVPSLLVVLVLAVTGALFWINWRGRRKLRAAESQGPSVAGRTRV